MRIIANYLAAIAALICCVMFGSTVAQAEWPVQSCSHRHRIPVVITATGGLFCGNDTVYNAVRPSVTGLNNQALGGTNGNYGWCISAVLNVTPATAGVWQFRYGGDFG